MGVYSRHLRPRLHTFALNDRLTGEVRDRVCAGLRGDVLEIGYGAGLDQPHLPPAVTGVWAIEPSVTAIKLSAERQAASPVPVVVRWQRRGNRINRAISGRVLDNDVRSLLDGSPLTITELAEHYEKTVPKAAAYMYEGRATA